MNGKLIRVGSACMLMLGSTCVADEVVLISGQDANKTAFNDAQYWEPQVAPNTPEAASYDYVITRYDGKPMTMRTPASGKLNVFGGKSLHINGYSCSVVECLCGGTTNRYANQGLFLEMGSYAIFPSRWGEVTIDGLVTVKSKDGSFTVSAGQVSGTGVPSVLRFAGAFSSARDDGAGNRIGLCSTCTDKGSRVVFAGDMSGYLGVLRQQQPQGWTSFGNISVGGDVFLENGRLSAEKAGDAPQFATLTVATAEGSGELFVPVDAQTGVCGQLIVCDAYSQTTPLTVILSAWPTVANHAREVEFPLLTLTSDCTGELDEALFEFGGAAGAAQADVTYTTSLRVVTGEDGSRTLTLKITAVPTIKMTTSDHMNNDDPLVWPSAFTNSQSWSDHEAPHDDADYLVNGAYTRIRSVYTLEDRFNGRSLSLTNGATLTQLTKFLTVDDLRLYPGALVLLNSDTSFGQEDSLRGKLTTVSAAEDDFIKFNVYFWQKFALDAELYGNGNLQFYGTPGSAHPDGTVILTNAAPNFAGTWYFTIGDKVRADVECPTETNCETLRLGCGEALGGPLPDFNYKALRLDQMSVLETVNSLTLDEPTRGILIGNVARFRVKAGHAMSVLSPLTVDGELRKEGDGLLALGGTLRFLDGEGVLSDEPVAGKNLFKLSAGSVKPLSAHAFDGLAISVTAAGARLVYDYSPADADLATYGLCNVKNETDPFVSSVGPVTFVFDGAFPERGVTLGLMTLKTHALAEAAKALLQPVRIKGYSQTCSVRDNLDGTATVVCEVAPRGMAIIFR